MAARFNTISLYAVIFLLLFPKLISSRFPTSKKCPGAHCNNPLGINLKQIQRLQRIKEQILYALGFQSDHPIKNRTSSQSVMDNKHISISLANRTDTNNGGPEIISFSESIGKRTRKKSMLEFVIHVGQNKSHLEVVSAHLWLLIKKRRPQKQSKTIILKVFKVDKKLKSELTYLRTRVKKTRWQKLSLPISLVQNIVKPPEGRLRLKIECRRCGRVVRLVLPKGVNKNRSRIVPPTRTLRLRKIKRRPRPFLVINTRIKPSL